MIGYDTIALRLPSSRWGTAKPLTVIPPLLKHVSETAYRDTRKGYVGGNLGNLYVSVSEGGAKVTGSLCKYYHGDNLGAFSRQETKEAITMLSDTLHVPMQEANVTRIDLAGNIVTNMIPAAYYPSLGATRHYERLEQPNGLDYRRGTGGMSFYDKIREHLLKKGVIPANLQDTNLLRYERRFTQRLRKEFGYPEITAEMLYDEKFYLGIITRWEMEYFKIPKYRHPILSEKALTSVKDFQNLLMLKGVEYYGGEGMVHGMIDASRELTLFKNKMQKARFLEKLKDICSTPGLTCENDLIIELDEKIRYVAAHCM